MVDAIDRRLIAATQAGLPLVPQPYRALGRTLGIGRAEVIARLRRLLDAGAIRRIGAIPNHYALGLAANGMSVWDVADDAVAEIGARGRRARLRHPLLRAPAASAAVAVQSVRHGARPQRATRSRDKVAAHRRAGRPGRARP